MRTLAAIALFYVCFLDLNNLSLGSELPSAFGIGLNSEEFSKKVEEFQKQNGDSMGFYPQPCALDPLLPSTDTLKITRAIRATSSTGEIVLIGLKDGKVAIWRQFALPNFNYWIDRYQLKCEGSHLLVEGNGEKYTYNWDGVNFSFVSRKKVHTKRR